MRLLAVVDVIRDRRTCKVTRSDDDSTFALCFSDNRFDTSTFVNTATVIEGSVRALLDVEVFSGRLGRAWGVAGPGSLR